MILHRHSPPFVPSSLPVILSAAKDPLLSRNCRTPGVPGHALETWVANNPIGPEPTSAPKQATPKAGCPMHDSLTVMRGSIDQRSIPSGTELHLL